MDRAVLEAEAERCRLQVLCADLENVLKERRSRGKSRDVMGDFARRQAVIVERYRVGGIDVQELRAELDEAFEEVKFATRRSRPSVFVTAYNRRQAVSPEPAGEEPANQTPGEKPPSRPPPPAQPLLAEGEVAVSLCVTLTQGNAARIVGVATPEKMVEAMCKALEAVSTEGGSCDVAMEWAGPKAKAPEQRSFRILDYATVVAIMRVFANYILSWAVEDGLSESEELGWKDLERLIRQGESPSFTAAWPHVQGAYYCKSMGLTDCMHERRHVEPDTRLDEADAHVGTRNEGLQLPERLIVVHAYAPIRTEEAHNTLNSTTKSFEVQREERVRYMCATCEQIFQTEEALKAHTCVCVCCGGSVRRDDMAKHKLDVCPNRAFACPKCGATHKEFYGKGAREAWVKRHEDVDCPVREVFCKEPGCGESFKPSKMGQGEAWLVSHVCRILCMYCAEKLLPGIAYDKHVRYECPLLPVECKCGEAFAPKAPGEGRLWRQQHVCKKGFCKMCQQEFPLGAAFEKHMAGCSRRPIDCDACSAQLPACPMRFADRSAFLEHHKAHECPMRGIKCSLCGESHTPSAPGGREAWLQEHAAMFCPCRQVQCADCLASYKPKRLGLREEWIKKHRDICPMRENTCPKCLETSGGPFKALGEREAWLDEHVRNACSFRPVSCAGCKAVFVSESREALARWDRLHRCVAHRPCRFCKLSIQVQANPYVCRGRQEQQFAKHAGVGGGGLSLRGFLEISVEVGLMSEGALKDWVRTQLRRNDVAVFVDAFNYGLGQQLRDEGGARLSYEQYLCTAESLDSEFVLGPVREHEGVCPLRSVTCKLCGERYQPRLLGQREAWLKSHDRSLCPLRAVSCGACKEVFVPTQRGQIDEWRASHQKTCPARKLFDKVGPGQHFKGPTCMCATCVALRKPAQSKFRKGVQAWVDRYRTRSRDVDLEEYVPPPEREGWQYSALVQHAERKAREAFEKIKSWREGEGEYGWFLRENAPVVTVDADAKKPPGVTQAVSFDFNHKSRQRAEQMREERLRFSESKAPVWVRDLLVAETPVPKCAGLEVVKCDVCGDLHKVYPGHREKVWLETHMGDCQQCGVTSVCAQHKCPTTPTAHRPPSQMSLQRSVTQPSQRPASATAIMGSRPIPVLVPSFSGFETDAGTCEQVIIPCMNSPVWAVEPDGQGVGDGVPPHVHTRKATYTSRSSLFLHTHTTRTSSPAANSRQAAGGTHTHTHMGISDAVSSRSVTPMPAPEKRPPPPVSPAPKGGVRALPWAHKGTRKKPADPEPLTHTRVRKPRVPVDCWQVRPGSEAPLLVKARSDDDDDDDDDDDSDGDGNGDHQPAGKAAAHPAVPSTPHSATSPPGLSSPLAARDTESRDIDQRPAGCKDGTDKDLTGNKVKKKVVKRGGDRDKARKMNRGRDGGPRPASATPTSRLTSRGVGVLKRLTLPVRVVNVEDLIDL